MKLLLVVAMLLSAIVTSWASVPVRPRPGRAKAKVVVPQGPRRPSSRSEAKEQAKSAHSGKGTYRRVMVTKMVHGHLVRVARVVRVKAGPVVPPHPDTDRLKEIQKALADKGYFKGEVNGAWDADSVAALKQFQTDKNLTPDGKINALSLIGLGLGPKHDGGVASIPADKPQPNIPQ